jgi:hypothetical protein
MGLFLALCAFHLVQDFVALIDAWPNLLLAGKARRVVEVADDAPIFEKRFRREIKLGRHTSETPSGADGFRQEIGAAPPVLPSARRGRA